MYALAICARSNDPKTKIAAYNVINDVCRIPTHLFLFVIYCEQVSSGSGWGRAHKRAIDGWYENKAKVPRDLARMVTKCRAAEKWCHKDVIRLAHTKGKAPALDIIIRYLIRGMKDAEELYKEYSEKDEQAQDGLKDMMVYLRATEEARRCTDYEEMVKLIRDHSLEREHITTQLLNSKDVWEALVDVLVERRQMTAIIRNLGKITSLGLCDDGSDVERKLCNMITNLEFLKRGRIHPFQVLVAYTTYQRGRGDRGSLAWQPNEHIKKALLDAFELSFQTVKPTDKKHLITVDVSGSMHTPCVGNQAVTCREATAAMLLTTAKREKKENYDVLAFSQGLTPLDIEKKDGLSDVYRKFDTVAFGRTDCAQPIVWAMENKKAYDVFIVYTDIETWYDRVHPARALQEYRNSMKIPDVHLVVVGLASHGFTIADPEDFGMLDIVGFDFGAMDTMHKFISGTL